MIDSLVESRRTLLCDDPTSPDMAVPALLAAELDDRTVAYAIAMRAPFEELRRVAAQLAGILVLSAAGSREATPGHPMLALAGQALDEAIDVIRTTTAPPQGGHHHQHLTRAAAWIARALAHARSGSAPPGKVDVDGTLSLLRKGWQELQWTAGALPGFEIVALEQSCCAQHGLTTGKSASSV